MTAYGCELVVTATASGSRLALAMTQAESAFDDVAARVDGLLGVTLMPDAEDRVEPRSMSLIGEGGVDSLSDATRPRAQGSGAPSAQAESEVGAGDAAGQLLTGGDAVRADPKPFDPAGYGSKRRRTAVVCAAAAIAAVVFVGLIVLVSRSSDERASFDGPASMSTQSSERSAPPPSPTAEAAAARLLTGDAHLVATFRDASSPLLDLSATSSLDDRVVICRDVADRLGRDVPPDDLLDAAGSIADLELGELAIGDRTARSDLIVACLARDAKTTERLLQQVIVIERLFNARLEKL